MSRKRKAPPSSSADSVLDVPLTIAQFCKQYNISRTTSWRVRRYQGLPTTWISGSPRILPKFAAAWFEQNTKTGSKAVRRRAATAGRRA